MVGIHIEDSLLKETNFINSNNIYSIVSNCKLETVKLETCNFENSSIFNNILKNVVFETVNLRKSEITNTSFKDIDVTTSNIENMIVDLKSIVGMKVNKEQACSLSNLLGINVIE